MKRICSLFIVISILGIMCIGTAAATPGLDGVFVTQEIIDSTAEESAMRIAQGKKIMESGGNAVARRSGNILSVPLLYQGDSRWGNLYFPCGHDTYANSGCAMTSYAMIFRYFGNSSATPVTVATDYAAIGGEVCDQVVADVVDLEGLSVTASGGSTNKSNLIAAIMAGVIRGEPTIVRFYVNSWNSSHYVVAYGYEYVGGADDYIVYIRDPEGRARYTRLSQYFDRGYCQSWATIG